MFKKIISIFTMVLLGYVAISQLCMAQEPKHPNPPACAEPDVDKPNQNCPGSECWGTPTCSPNYYNTCSQAASANVIYAECCLCTELMPNQIYESIYTQTGNVPLSLDEQKTMILTWANANCTSCSIEVNTTSKGYPGKDGVNPKSVTFAYADQQIASGKHVTIWVSTLTKLLDPSPPSGKYAQNHSLTYLGRIGSQAFIHDSDCDIGGRDDNFYIIDHDANGDFLTNYFGSGSHGYLRGILTVEGKTRCSVPIPSMTEFGMIFLITLLIFSTIFIILKRGKALLHTKG
jgi:hypothetical protein